MAEGIVTIVAEGLRLLAGVAPSVAQAFTGGQSVEDAIAAAESKAKAIPDSTDELERDLAVRKARG